MINFKGVYLNLDIIKSISFTEIDRCSMSSPHYTYINVDGVKHAIYERVSVVEREFNELITKKEVVDVK